MLRLVTDSCTPRDRPRVNAQDSAGRDQDACKDVLPDVLRADGPDHVEHGSILGLLCRVRPVHVADVLYRLLLVGGQGTRRRELVLPGVDVPGVGQHLGPGVNVAVKCVALDVPVKGLLRGVRVFATVELLHQGSAVYGGLG